jgi:hypothetical protein
LSIFGDNCRCGAEERGADLSYTTWHEYTQGRATTRMKNWQELQLLPSQVWPYRDERAGAGEETPPWLLAGAVRDIMLEAREIAEDMSVHEFAWHCRRCRDHQACPMFVVRSYVDERGWCDYWVRATTIGWRRRYRHWGVARMEV